MPLMSPTRPSDSDTAKESNGAEYLQPAEILPSQSPNIADVLKFAGVDQRRGKSKMSPLLIQEGLGLEECARRLSSFAFHSEKEELQYKAVEMALKLHGELEPEERKDSGVQIVFAGVTPEILNVLIPR